MECEGEFRGAMDYPILELIRLLEHTSFGVLSSVLFLLGVLAKYSEW